MAKKIDYADSIFYLNEQIRILTDCLDLDIDGDLYLDKVVEDILFIEGTMESLTQSLTENPRLLDRADHLHSIMRAKGRYAHLLESIARGEINFSRHLFPFSAKFRQISAKQREDIEDIRRVLSSESDSGFEDTKVVSEQELHFLLMEDDRQDEESV